MQKQTVGFLPQQKEAFAAQPKATTGFVSVLYNTCSLELEQPDGSNLQSRHFTSILIFCTILIQRALSLALISQQDLHSHVPPLHRVRGTVCSLASQSLSLPLLAQSSCFTTWTCSMTCQASRMKFAVPLNACQGFVLPQSHSYPLFPSTRVVYHRLPSV